LNTPNAGFTIGGTGVSREPPWIGSIAEVAAFDHVLSADRITAHYRAGLALSRIGRTALPTDAYGQAVWAAKPVAYWRLDENAGATAVDLGDGHQAGTYQPPDSYQLGVPGPQQRPSAYFYGSGYAALRARGNLPVLASPRSIEVWFNAADSGYRTLFAYGGSRSNASLLEIQRNEGKIGLIYGSNGIYSTTATTPNQWHHAVITYDGKTTVQIYVDGKLDGSGTTALPLNTGWVFARIGAGGAYASPWYGGLAEVAVYDYVLPANVIAQHYQIGASSPAAPAPSEWF
jgi:hypothetical protein